MSARHVDRRRFLSLTGMALGMAPFHALACRAVDIETRRALQRGSELGRGGGYGPLQPATDETTGLPLLHLPAGFRYLSFGWTGDPLRYELTTPEAHDGMAAFASPGSSRIQLVRNHERRERHAVRRQPHLRSPRGRRHDDDRVRHRHWRRRDRVGQPRGDGGQLCGRRHPLGVVAELRRDRPWSRWRAHLP